MFCCFFSVVILLSFVHQKTNATVPDFYQNKNDRIYWGGVLTNIDAHSFNALSENYAVDSDNAYYMGSIIDESHSPSFELINQYYAKDKDTVYVFGRKIDVIDVDNFEILKISNKTHFYDFFSSDGSSIYYCDLKFSNKLPEDFLFMDFHILEKNERVLFNDKMCSYFYISQINEYFIEIDGVDLSSFNVLNLFFSKDNNNVYYKGNQTQFDGKTFEIIDNYLGYYKDQNGVFLFDDGNFKRLNIEYSNSFKDIGCNFQIDENNVYYKFSKINGKAPMSESLEFVNLDNGSYCVYLYDSESVYFWDMDEGYFIVIDGADKKSFRSISATLSKDDNNVYFNGQVFFGARPESLKVIAFNYLKDDRNVFYKDKLIHDADPVSFKRAYMDVFQDKNHFYRNGEVLTSDNPIFMKYKYFSDVSFNSEYHHLLQTLANMNIVRGYPGRKFGWRKKITRAEVAKIIYLTWFSNIEFQNGKCFSDVVNHWSEEYVCSLQKIGLVSGNINGYFEPERKITFSEASKIFVEMFALEKESLRIKLQTDNDNSNWYGKYLNALQENGIEVMKPYKIMTRNNFIYLMDQAKNFSVIHDDVIYSPYSVEK
ncbi:MAG: DKNYY domain-containing protein [Candidatus Gracilibacteria bacterium]|nr:DKNYY domain-containing protein [Candidatus Gracilibacteria bacterium]